jgi:tetratricopeptide (TPR) repeat protein
MQATPPVAATLAKVGAIEEGRRNLALAAKAFEMAHVADPRDLRIAERLGRLYLQQGNIDGAGLLFASVVADEPESPRALDGMGEVHLVRGDYRQAIRFFDRALHSSGVDRATVLTHRGHAALNLDDVAAAESDLKAAIGIAPRPDTWRHLAELEVRRGNNAAALECLSNVMDLSRSYNEIGLLLLKHSNHRAAADYFAKAVSAAPTWYEEANKNLAVANEHLGNRPK